MACGTPYQWWRHFTAVRVPRGLSLPASLQAARVVLQKGKSRLFWGAAGSPIAFGGAVDRIVGAQPKNGCGDGAGPRLRAVNCPPERQTLPPRDAVLLCDHNDNPLGWGAVNLDSMYRVRVLQTAAEAAAASGRGAEVTLSFADIVAGALARPQAVDRGSAQQLANRRPTTDHLSPRLNRTTSAARGGRRDPPADRPPDSGPHDRLQAREQRGRPPFRACRGRLWRLRSACPSCLCMTHPGRTRVAAACAARSSLLRPATARRQVAAVTAAWAEQNKVVIAAAVLRVTGAKAVLWRANADYLRLEGMQGAALCGPSSTSPRSLGAPQRVVLNRRTRPAVRLSGTFPPTIVTPDGKETQLKLPGWSSDEPAAAGEGGHSDPAAEAAARSGGEPASVSGGSLLPDPYEVLEDGVRYLASLSKGQKTGFYFDQRENRARVRKWAPGARVLDLCCYSGGFAVNAALGGAASVTAVDSSASALRLAAANGEGGPGGGGAGGAVALVTNRGRRAPDATARLTSRLPCLPQPS